MLISRDHTLACALCSIHSSYLWNEEDRHRFTRVPQPLQGTLPFHMHGDLVEA